MEAAERDTTDEWRIAPARAPATVAELEGRIDVALATARSAEEAALEIGAASLEAAEQARRAAALAERASASAMRAAGAAQASGAREPSPADLPSDAAQVATPAESPRTDSAGPIDPAPAPLLRERRRRERRANGLAPPDPFEQRINAFRLRAEKVMIRLRKLEAGASPGGPSEVVRLR
jgi:hypothetical protein